MKNNVLADMPGAIPGNTDWLTRNRMTVFGCIIALFGILIAPYSGVHLPKPLILLIGAGALFGLVMMTMSRLDYVLLLLVSYIPFSKILVGDFGGALKGMNAFNVLFIFILLAVIVENKKRNDRYFTTSVDVLIMLYCLLAVVSLIRGGTVMGNNLVNVLLVDLKRWLSPILLYFLGVNALKERDLRKDVIITVMLTVTVVGLLGLKEYYLDKRGGSTWEKVRIGGIAEQANQLGAFFVYYMPFLVAFYLTGITRLKNWGLLFPILVCLRALMLTVSRAAFLAFGMGGYALVFLRNKVLFVFLLMLSSMVIMVPDILPEIITARFGGIIREEAVVHEGGMERYMEGSARMRVYALQGGLEMIADYPVLGIGYGQFPRQIPMYSPMIPYSFDSHNGYLNIATEMGVPALALFILILIVIFRNTHYVYIHSDDRFIRTAALGFLMSMVGIFISNFFGSRMEALELAGYIWILAAVFMREAKELKSREGSDGGIETRMNTPEETGYPDA